MMKMQCILFFVILMSIQGQAQSKKELLKKNDELQKTNLKLERSNAVLNENVKNLNEQVKRLELELEQVKESEKLAIEAKAMAIMAEKKALEKEKLALEAKKVATEELQRIDAILAKASQENPKVKRASVVGRYYAEDQDKRKGEYIELFDDGTLMIQLPENSKKSPVKHLSGTYKLKEGNKITLIATLFTLTTTKDGRMENNRLIVLDKGKEDIFIRK
ncbi:MAG: hypothetical protein MK212_09915 [Saprospiraceae bacterium]|nr:hypothetical protein [Saprospiraceae bacterium]